MCPYLPAHPVYITKLCLLMYVPCTTLAPSTRFTHVSSQVYPTWMWKTSVSWIVRKTIGHDSADCIYRCGVSFFKIEFLMLYCSFSYKNSFLWNEERTANANFTYTIWPYSSVASSVLFSLKWCVYLCCVPVEHLHIVLQAFWPSGQTGLNCVPLSATI